MVWNTQKCSNDVLLFVCLFINILEILGLFNGAVSMSDWRSGSKAQRIVSTFELVFSYSRSGTKGRHWLAESVLPIAGPSLQTEISRIYSRINGDSTAITRTGGKLH